MTQELFSEPTVFPHAAWHIHYHWCCHPRHRCEDHGDPNNGKGRDSEDDYKEESPIDLVISLAEILTGSYTDSIVWLHVLVEDKDQNPNRIKGK
jgi:hypothetical protein